ncbi:MAG: universal stress protein [Proteobacteria bacterium]|nr:universal stress protein [Pseudomonadota bacterium]
MHRRILLAFDGSDASDAALLELLKIIREPTHEILIVHVMHLSPTEDYSAGTVGSIMLEPRRHAGQKMLEDARARPAERGVSVEDWSRVINKTSPTWW